MINKVLIAAAAVGILVGGTAAYAATTATNHAMSANTNWNVTCPNALTPSNQQADSIYLNCADNPTTTTVAPTTTTTTTVGGGGGSGGYNLVSGYPVMDENGTGHTGSTTMGESITIVNPGDLIVVYAHDQNYGGAQHVTSITDSAGLVSWQNADIARQPVSDDTQQELWYGVSNGIGTTTVNVHWANATDDGFVYVWEFHANAGSAWSVVQAGNVDQDLSDSSTVTYPNLESGSNGGIYVGPAYLGVDSNKGVSPAGFSYETTEFDNIVIWDANLANTTVYDPTTTQQGASGWDTLGAIFSKS